MKGQVEEKHYRYARVQASIVDSIVRVNIIVLMEGCKTGCLCRTMPGGAPKMNTVKDLSILK